MVVSNSANKQQLIETLDLIQSSCRQTVRPLFIQIIGSNIVLTQNLRVVF